MIGKPPPFFAIQSDEPNAASDMCHTFLIFIWYPQPLTLGKKGKNRKIDINLSFRCHSESLENLGFCKHWTTPALFLPHLHRHSPLLISQLFNHGKQRLLIPSPSSILPGSKPILPTPTSARLLSTTTSGVLPTHSSSSNCLHSTTASASGQ